MLDKAPRTDGAHKSALSGADSSGHDDVFTFSDIFDFVRNNHRTIAMSMAVPLGLAFFYLLTATPVYTARTAILLDPQMPQPLAQQQVPTISNTFDSPQVESQIAVLLSEQIALSVVKDLNLSHDPEFNPAAVEVAEGETPPELDPIQQQIVLYSVMDGLEARRAGVSFAIDVAYTSKDPQKAAKIANAFAQAFVQDQINTRAAAVRAGGDWLESRIEEIRQTMNRAARRVQEFRVKRDYRLVNRDSDSPRTIVGRELPTPAPTPVPGTTPPADGAPVTPGTAEGVAPKPAPPLAKDDIQQRDRETSLDELETTAQTYRKIYESYLQAYAESVQRQSFPVSNARIISVATPPLSKSHPKSFLVLAFASILGLIIGFGVAIVKSNWRPEPSQTA